MRLQGPPSIPLPPLPSNVVSATIDLANLVSEETSSKPFDNDADDLLSFAPFAGHGAVTDADSCSMLPDVTQTASLTRMSSCDTYRFNRRAMDTYTGVGSMDYKVADESHSGSVQSGTADSARAVVLDDDLPQSDLRQAQRSRMTLKHTPKYQRPVPIGLHQRMEHVAMDRFHASTPNFHLPPMVTVHDTSGVSSAFCVSDIVRQHTLATSSIPDLRIPREAASLDDDPFGISRFSDSPVCAPHPETKLARSNFLFRPFRFLRKL
ncbi:hypothetical protein M422DRAFT_251909, partial [Sphaerobolus stellatus SS14]